MKIEVAYVGRHRQALLSVNAEEGATLEAVIRQSGILVQFPEIDLAVQKVGVFGRARALDATLRAGERVEIYRPATADPALARQGEEAGDA
ncbi:MAG: RnfH family protein [Candidatus Dactylopiibacterium sp.]|nr:RnfH family protein [Candidatus Dactylopiibacterium sp.]